MKSKLLIARNSALFTASAFGILALSSTTIYAQVDLVNHEVNLLYHTLAPNVQPIAPRLPYVVTPQATATGTIPLVTPWSYGVGSYGQPPLGIGSYVPVNMNGAPAAQPNQAYNQVRVQAAAYQGPVYSVPATMASYRLPVESLNGRVLQAIPTPPPALPQVIVPPVAPVAEPVLPLPPIPKVTVSPPPPTSSGLYVVAKAMLQDPENYSWNDASAGAVNYVQTHNHPGRTAILAVGKRLDFLPIPKVSLEAEASYRLAFSTNGHTGKHKIFGAAINVIKEFNPVPRVGIYGGVGVGFANVKHRSIDDGDTLTEAMSDDDTALMLNGFGGVDFRLNKHLTLMLEARKLYLPEVDRENDGGGVSSSSYAATEGGIGIKFGF